MADYFELLFLVAELAGIVLSGFFIGRGIHRLLVSLFKRIVRKTATTIDDYVLEAVQKPLEIIVIVLCFFIISEFFDNLGAINALLSRYLLSIVIILASYLASEIIAAFLKGYVADAEKKKLSMDFSLIPFMRKASRVFIPLLGIAVSLSVIGIDLTGLFAVTSVVVLILGFASQETLANVFAGLVLQLDRPFYYNDYLRFSNGDVGKLVKIGLRTTKLEDLHGNKVTMSNSEFAKQKVTNLSRTYHNSNLSILAEVPLKTDIKKLEGYLLKKVDAQKDHYLKEQSVSVKIDKIAKDHIQVSVSLAVKDIEKLDSAKDFVNYEILKFSYPENK